MLLFCIKNLMSTLPQMPPDTRKTWKRGENSKADPQINTQACFSAWLFLFKKQRNRLNHISTPSVITPSWMFVAPTTHYVSCDQIIGWLNNELSVNQSTAEWFPRYVSCLNSRSNCFFFIVNAADAPT